MRIEIIHDALAEKIFETASLEDKNRLRVQRFIRERVEYHDSDAEDFYLSEKELRYVEPCITHIELTSKQRAFYNQSKQTVQSQRRWNKIKKYSSIAVVCTLLASTWGLWWRNKALTEEEIANHKLIELYEFSKQVENAHGIHDLEQIKSRASDIVEEQFSDQNAITVLQGAGLITANEIQTHEHYHPHNTGWVAIGLKGLVLSEQQSPIPNVKIKMLGQEIQTDTNGKFRLSVLADEHAIEEQTITIIIEHNQYLSQTLEQPLHNWSIDSDIVVTLKKP